MRRYDEPLEVRRGPVPGWPDDGPAQFLWRGRLWKVRAVVAHWVETGPWWQHAGLRAVIGTDDVPLDPSGSTGTTGGGTAVEELLGERELWRVEAGPGSPGNRSPGDGSPGSGTFDLAHDPTHAADGAAWQLVGCAD